jgi:thiol-disulfide isomerase/thioredoxin
MNRLAVSPGSFRVNCLARAPIDYRLTTMFDRSQPHCKYQEKQMRIRTQHWLQRISGVALAAMCCSPLMAEDEAELPALTIGSKAPALDIENWVSDGKGKFKPVKEFQKDQVYVVEFWATWCGPCIGSMPHLAETQQKYADKHVQLVSISDEDMDTVNEFLKKEVQDSDKKQTYGELTSAYCLTTDPDRSVYVAYMDAAGQNGIPTAFIVGKSGLIEWIGHPMSMDEPLEQVVDNKWDREVFLAKFKAEQERDLLMAKIMNLMRGGKVEEALAMIAEKKEESKDDTALVEMLDDLAFRVRVSTAAQKLQQGEDPKAVLAELDAIAKTATPDQQAQIEMGKVQLLLMLVLSSGEHADLAAASMTDLAAKKDVDPNALNMIAWKVYEVSQSKEDLPKELIAAATKLAERAVKEVSDRGDVIDTLSHLVYAQGDLDRAIELQTDAVKKADAQSKEQLEQFLEELKKEKAGKK